MKQNKLSVSSGTVLSDLDECDLHRRTPFGVTNVRMTQFSIARFYGCIKFNGEGYTYIPETDELIRDDVLAWKLRTSKDTAPLRKTKHE